MNNTIEWPVIDGWIPIGSIITIEDPVSGKKFKVKRTMGTNHADVEPLTAKDNSIIRRIFPIPDNFKSAPFHKVKVHIGNDIVPAAFMTFPHAGAKDKPGNVIPSDQLSGYSNTKNKNDIYSDNQLANRNYIQDNNANGHMCLYFKGSLNHLTNKPESKATALLESKNWNLPTEYNNAADRIKEYYLKHFDELKEEKQSHFLQRLQVCYGPHWKKKIHKLNEWIVDETWELWNEYKDGDFSRSEQNKLKSKGDATGVYSKEKNLFPGVKNKSNAWAIAHLPEFAWEQGFGAVQNNYSILVRLDMLKNLKNKEDIKKWLQDGWMERWEWLLANPTVIISHPVHTVNYLYHGL